MAQSGALQSAVLLKTATLGTEVPNRVVSKRSVQELVNQITTFGCSLAKHRKSPTLDAKDILLHLERNIPGFGGDELRAYKKPIKKSIVAPAAQSGGKSHTAKAPSNIIGSPPKPKIREAA